MSIRPKSWDIGARDIFIEYATIAASQSGDNGEEYFVTCRRCGKRYERDIPRRPQDDPTFLCDNCQQEFNFLVTHGEAGKWREKVS